VSCLWVVGGVRYAGGMAGASQTIVFCCSVSASLATKRAWCPGVLHSSRPRLEYSDALVCIPGLRIMRAVSVREGIEAVTTCRSDCVSEWLVEWFGFAKLEATS
jgi:hypothetical protein